MMSPLQARAKRGLDIAVSTVGLGLCWPLLASIAVAVRLDSPGPAFYRPQRTGLHGAPFRMFKFRTMVTGADRIGPSTTGARDPRVTRLGEFLRSRKLDELPQLLNVLRGEMSIVGPRPELFEYTDGYSDTERRILDVKPGITDLASLAFFRLDLVVGGDDPDAVFRTEVLPRKNALRLAYVERQSLALDLQIIGRTAVAVLGALLRR